MDTVHKMSNDCQSRRYQTNISSTTATAPEEEARQYWAARKRIRCSPIAQGKDRNDLLRNTDAFFEHRLAIPPGELHGDAVMDVQRIPGRKKNRNQNEVVITFDSIQTRDCVASYASNLANYNGDPALRPCLLYTSPSPRDGLLSRMPSSA